MKVAVQSLLAKGAKFLEVGILIIIQEQYHRVIKAP